MTPKTADFYANPLKKGTNDREYHLGDTSLTPSEAMTLHHLVRESGVVRALDIGTALGASAVAIAEAFELRGGSGSVTTLDPFQNAFGNVGVSELARLGLESRAHFVPAFAEEFLCEARNKKEFYDFALVDSAHSIGIKMTITFFADFCLSPSGIMAFHDAFMRSTAICVKYLVHEHGYESIPLKPDSAFKRLLRMGKYAFIHGPHYAWHIVRHTHRSLVALRKPAQPREDS